MKANLSRVKNSGLFLCPELAPSCQRRKPRQPNEQSAGLKEDGVFLSENKMKKCGRCKKLKITDEFHIRASGLYKGYLECYCKSCALEIGRFYYKTVNGKKK